MLKNRRSHSALMKVIALLITMVPTCFAQGSPSQGGLSPRAGSAARIPSENQRKRPEKEPRDERQSMDRGSIHVHGHWAIDIRDKHGAVVSHHEFENSLVSASLIDELLTGSLVGGWSITLASNICDTAGGTAPADCLIAPPRGGSVSGTQPGNFFANLGLQIPGQSIVLVGSAKAAHDAQVTQVKTEIITCTFQSSGPQIQTSADCKFFLGNTYSLHSIPFHLNDFTIRDLSQASPPIQVKAGQYIDVTVTITFS